MTSDYMKYRGKCKEFCQKAIQEDPTLTLVRGWYFCPIWNTDNQHWWCKRQDGTIYDPTKDQFPSKGHGVYTEFDGYFPCEYCGKEVHEKDAYFVEQHVYCTGACYGHDVGF
jgi:hypothetical protein